MWPSTDDISNQSAGSTVSSSSSTASASATDATSIPAGDLHRLSFSSTTAASGAAATAAAGSASVSASAVDVSASVSASGTSSAAVASASATTAVTSSGSGGSASAPHWVIYSDAWLTAMPSVSDLQGYNRFILAFWMSNSGAVDNAQFWTGLGSAKQQETLAAYNAAGITLMVSAFGSTDNPTTAGADPTQTAQNLATWVKANNLNGVDIDYEDNAAFNGGYAEAWLITFQNELRNQLPSPYIISHAPQAPWFTTNGQYSGGGYLKIHEQVGSGIDFYNVQFYNQGASAYTTCDSLLNSSEFPGTSVFEMAASGIELEKIVIGKPINSGAASNGYMDTSTLNTCVSQAKSKGWNAGVMYWEYDSSAISVMAAVQG